MRRAGEEGHSASAAAAGCCPSPRGSAGASSGGLAASRALPRGPPQHLATIAISKTSVSAPVAPHHCETRYGRGERVSRYLPRALARALRAGASSAKAAACPAAAA